MITRDQVADLRPGDVVELRWKSFPDVHTCGPLHGADSGSLHLGWHAVRSQTGAVACSDADTLTVVSRAPRPLYVNHPRTEPVPGDVVRQEGSPLAHTWHFLGTQGEWCLWRRFDDTRVPFDEGAPLRLLVDGETGQVVP